MDPFDLGLVDLSAACFLAFDLWARSSPRGQLEVVRAPGDDPSATAVVDNTPPTSGERPLVRLTEMLRLRRHRGRCD